MNAPALVAWTPLDRTMLCLDCEATYAIGPTTLGGDKPCPRCGNPRVVPIARWLDREQGGQ